MRQSKPTPIDLASQVGQAARQELDQIAAAIFEHVASRPDDFDGREALWMRREDLRAQLAA